MVRFFKRLIGAYVYPGSGKGFLASCDQVLLEEAGFFYHGVKKEFRYKMLSPRCMYMVRFVKLGE